VRRTIKFFRENHLLLRLVAHKVEIMIKTLLLLRHANAVEADATTDDYDRPLSSKGVQECAVTAATLLGLQESVQWAMVSSARRTRQTAEAMIQAGCVKAAHLPHNNIQYDDGLYLASSGDMLQRIQALPNHVQCALLIGHNPGIGEIAPLLAHTLSTDYIRHGMKTCGLVRLVFEGKHWSDIRPQSCIMTHYLTP
jgi:phosphohistidine phosphatase